MKEKFSINPAVLFLGIPLLLIVSVVILAKSLNQLALEGATMYTAITLDLVLTVPIVYFFLIRKREISKFTVMPFFVGGLVIASFIIPKSEQAVLEIIKTWLLPVVELTIITIVVIKVRKIRAVYTKEKGNGFDFLTALKRSTASFLPEKVATILSLEIGLIYYTFFNWKKPTYTANEFTYHKETGILGVLITLLGVALIELFCVHLLIHDNHPILSWVLTGISAYGVIQIVGLTKSIPRTPCRFEEEHLVMRMGLIQETKIPYAKIESVELTMNEYPKKDRNYAKITLFDHNCIIHLKEEEQMTGLFGMTKNYRKLVLAIDDKQGFKNRIEHEI